MPDSLSQRKKFLFSLLALSIILLVIASGLITASLSLQHKRRELGRLFHARQDRISLADVLKSSGASEARVRHVRDCYSTGQQTDLDAISWNQISQPAPFVGYQPEPGIQMEGPFNSQHMRSLQDLVLPRPADVYRIFMIGGSTAYGVGAPSPGGTISGHLEIILNEKGAAKNKRIEVLNASVCAWSSTHERIWIVNALSEWEPDLVLAFTGANDVIWGFSGSNIFNFRTWEDDLYLEALNTALTMAGVRPFSTTLHDRLTHPVDPVTVADRFAKNIGISAYALQAIRVPLVVCLQPCLSSATKTMTAEERAWMDDEEPPGMPDYLRDCYARMREKLAKMDTRQESFPTLEMIPVDHVFRGRSDAIYLDMLHLGDKGNQLVALELAGGLEPVIRRDMAQR